MKNFLFLLAVLSTLSCSNEFNDYVEPNLRITGRTLPNYIIPYQYPSGNIKSMTSSDLQTWSQGYTVSTTASKFGTSSTIYNYAIPDNQRRCLTIFQNSSDELKWVEYQDGGITWSSPASISTATSPLLPSVEIYDGVVHEVHHDGGANPVVKGSYKNGSSWVTPYNLTYYDNGQYPNIPTDFSPSLEYHATAGVEYLVTGYADHEFTGYGLPVIYWRYTNS